MNLDEFKSKHRLKTNSMTYKKMSVAIEEWVKKRKCKAVKSLHITNGIYQKVPLGANFQFIH